MCHPFFLYVFSYIYVRVVLIRLSLHFFRYKQLRRCYKFKIEKNLIILKLIVFAPVYFLIYKIFNL